MNRLRSGEYISPALRTVRVILRLPLWLKRFQARCLRWFSRPWGRNDAWAALLEVMHPKTTLAERELVVQREAYRAAWHEAWRREGLDFVLTPPHALPAMPVAPSASDTATLVSANYAFLYNVVSAPLHPPAHTCGSLLPAPRTQLDYAAGVLPVGTVDRMRDSYPPDFRAEDAFLRMNDVGRAALSCAASSRRPPCSGSCSASDVGEVEPSAGGAGSLIS